MRLPNRRWTVFLGASALCVMALLPEGSGASADPGTVPSVWQHYKGTVNYYGQTTLYTCDGLEGQVRRILLYLGARKDLKVRATGCGGPTVPVRSAWIDADFYALAPAADAGAANAVQARWAGVEITPQRPKFMGDGDCELVSDMKDLLSNGFSLRGVDYRTSCFPHDQKVSAFTVKGEALTAAQPNGKEN